MDISHSNILITGGAGFIGSNLAISLKKDFPKLNITCFDNLSRRGSILNVKRLETSGIKFIHGDIRNKEDFEQIGNIDSLIECSAEPSVLAGLSGSPEYVIQTNLFGTVNCLEFARINKAAFIFLSTSRVYPLEAIATAAVSETNTRFKFNRKQKTAGISNQGISEKLPLGGTRSFYGATKLASELLINEYHAFYGLKTVVNRCGMISGPWQMGKVDQGVVALWVAAHYFKKNLSYIGFGGYGKQVRDVLHIDDLYNLIKLQLRQLDKFNGKTFNVGGGLKNTVSLLELTKLCEHITGNKIVIKKQAKERPADLKIFVTDNSKIFEFCRWKPKKGIEIIAKDIYIWIRNNSSILIDYFNI